MLFIFTQKDEQRFHRNFTESINHMELNPRPEKIKALFLNLIIKTLFLAK